MPSRMEKYYSDTSSTRSERNAELYRTLYDNEEYTNIASVATIDKTNEVDLSKVRQMIKDRENYKKQQEFEQIIKPPVIEEAKEEETIYDEEEKTYDIRDVLNKAKETRQKDERYESIKNQKYDYLLNSKSYQKTATPKEDSMEELNELMNTITNTTKIMKLKDEDLSLDMLNDLKSNNNTMIESSSVRAIIEEEKKRQSELEKEKNTEMDKSFYTASLNLNKKDFEDLLDTNASVEEKNNNHTIRIILLVVLVVVFLVTATFLLSKVI